MQIEDSCLKINKLRSPSSFMGVFSIFSEVRQEWYMNDEIFKADDLDVHFVILRFFLLCSKLHMEWDMSCIEVIFTYIVINTLLNPFFVHPVSVMFHDTVFNVLVQDDKGIVFSPRSQALRRMWVVKKKTYS